LDYPPFFAWFEYALSIPAGLIAPEALEITAGTVQTAATVFYQRATVILSEGVMIYILTRRIKTDTLTQLAILLNFGLVLVDNIHFQYNSILFAMLLLSYHLI
jgi:alpha-1,3-glucosyltransferase